MDIPVLFNDRIIAKSKLTISPEDRGYYFGDGVYEVFRIYNGKLFATEAHLQRLVHSAQGINLQLPCSTDEIMQRMERLLDTSAVQEGILYLQITRGIAPRTHLIPDHLEPVMYAYCSELARPLSNMESGIAAITMPDIRWHLCHLKTLNLLPNTLAKQQAKEQGADEAIMHRDGRVTECSASNFMIVRDDKIFTHPADQWILPGITRQIVSQLAAYMGITMVEAPFTVDDLQHANEAFITGTTTEITPIVKIDGRAVGSGVPGPITRRLQDALERMIQTNG